MATLSTMNVGSTVYFLVGGTKKAFLVVHQGVPSTMYDSSCNGTWVMMADSYTTMAWDSTNNDYANSDIHAYLNGTFLSAFDEDIQRTIQKVKIPYWNGTGSGGSLASGANGLECKVFLPAHDEMVTQSTHFLPSDGTQLAFFATVDQNDFSDYETWLRSPTTGSTDSAGELHTYTSSWQVTTKRPIRPLLILPGECEVDSSGYVLPSITINGITTIGGSSKKLDKAYGNVGGKWKEITESYVNIGGVWKSTT